MITDSFDNTRPLVSLEAFYGPQRHLAQVCIILFSHKLQSYALDRFDCEQIAQIGACNGSTPIYAFTHGGRRIAFYLTDIGATMAAQDLLECNWLTGATKFIMFGSAGSLAPEQTSGRYVVPTEAYRDEGMSYHYAPPADYIVIRGHDRVAQIFDELHVPYVQGRVWTTDAILRETVGQAAKRRAEGCLAVEMELAGVQAVCDYHGLELYDFLETGDVLTEESYDPDGLSQANHRMDKLLIGLKIAERV